MQVLSCGLVVGRSSGLQELALGTPTAGGEHDTDHKTYAREPVTQFYVPAVHIRGLDIGQDEPRLLPRQLLADAAVAVDPRRYPAIRRHDKRQARLHGSEHIASNM